MREFDCDCDECFERDECYVSCFGKMDSQEKWVYFGDGLYVPREEFVDD